MTNSQVFGAFANRAHAEANSVRSERTPDGVVLYSYATPIAFFRDDADKPVFTLRRYSQTTSKQQTQAKNACGAYDEVVEADFRPAAREVGASFALAR